MDMNSEGSFPLQPMNKKVKVRSSII